MARTIAIEYGDLRVGETPSNALIRLADKHVMSISNTSVSVAFTVVISGDEADVITAENHLTDELRQRHQKLTITSAGGDRYVFDPAANSGFLTRGDARKTGGPTDTEKSREYVCSVAADLPEVTPGLDGRRQATIEVDAEASERRTFSATGSYTALGGNSAVAQFEAAVDVWVTGELVARGGTWNPIRRRFTYDDQNKVLSFSLIFQEIIFAEGAAGLDLAEVASQQVNIRVGQTSAARAKVFSRALPFGFSEILYSAILRKSLVDPKDQETFVQDKALPYVLSLVGPIVILRIDRHFSKEGNSVVLRLLGNPRKAGLLAAKVRVKTVRDFGRLLIPVADGNPLSRERYQSVGQISVTVSVDTLAVLGSTPSHRSVLPSELLEDRIVQLYDEVSNSVDTLGNFNTIDVEERSSVFVFAVAETPRIGASTAADGLGPVVAQAAGATSGVSSPQGPPAAAPAEGPPAEAPASLPPNPLGVPGAGVGAGVGRGSGRAGGSVAGGLTGAGGGFVDR